MIRYPDSTGPHPYRCRKGWGVVLLAVALLGVQTWLFGHELEHLSSGSDEAACEICLIGGGLAHAHFAAASPLAFPFPSDVVPKAAPDAPLIARRVFAYRGRAPPVVG